MAHFVALPDLSFNQKVKIGVIYQRLHCVVLAEEPGVVSRPQTLVAVVNFQPVAHHSLFEIVGQVVLAKQKGKVFLRKWKSERFSFEVVLELDHISCGEAP